MVRFYREKKGLRQQDLARLSGYSIRLIGKAEAGKPISPETIEDLAEALSSDKIQIGPQDLISHPVQTAHNYIDNLLDVETNQAWFKNFIARNISIKVLVFNQGTVRELAYEGVRGFEEYRAAFCNLFLNSTKGELNRSRKLFSSGNEVVIWHENVSCPVEQLGSELPKVSKHAEDAFFVTTKLLFSSGRLRRVEDRIMANSDSRLPSEPSQSASDSLDDSWPDFDSRESS